MEKVSMRDRLLACVQIIDISRGKLLEPGKNISVALNAGKRFFYKNMSSGEIILQIESNPDQIIIAYEKFDKWIELNVENSEKMIKFLEMESASLENNLEKKLKMKV